MKKTITWVKQNRLEFLVILLILLSAAFVRLYKIDQYMTFLGDEGRDALVIRGILVDHHFPLLGPPTSVGNMYLGPLYYYMMAVSMTVSYLNPVAAAVMSALVGLATIGLIYFLTRELFGQFSAFLAATLYAFSPVNIFYSRSSWNPDPAPFFALLVILGFYFSRKYKNYLWLVLSGGALAFAIQMHYLALILSPAIFLFWVYEFWTAKKAHLKLKNFSKGTVVGTIVFLFLMSPLAIFDLHHNFMNLHAIEAFFGNRQTTVNLNIFNTLSRIPTIYSYNLIGRYIAGENMVLELIVSLIVLIPVVKFLFVLLKKKEFVWKYFILSSWLVIGVLGLSLYKQSIFDHYLGFMNPAPYILLGAVFSSEMFKKIRIPKYACIVFGFILFGVLLIVNLSKNPLLQSPNNELKRTQEISKYVIKESDNKPFNFALLSQHNYDAAYQFYLTIYNYPPKKVPFDITDQLFVVCEDPICAPINNPKYEIAAFGWAKVVTENNFDGVKVFKLAHNLSTKR